MFDRIVGEPFFDSNKDPKQNKYDYLRFFLSKDNLVFLNDAVMRFRSFQFKTQQADQDIEYIATTSSSVMEFQRQFFAIPPLSDNYDARIEIDFFKALLLINEKVTNAINDVDEDSDCPLDLKLARLYLTYRYANEDVDSTDTRDTLRRQLTKCITLFKYLERDARMKNIRRCFFAHYRIGKWVEFVIPHIMVFLQLEQRSGLIKIDGKYKMNRTGRKVIKGCSLKYDETIRLEDNADFRVFRSKPFIDMGHNTYAVTNVTFLLEHLYNSLYFELKKYYKESNFVSDQEFRTYFTKNFSERFMFYNYVNRCLSGDEIKVLNGDDCEAIANESRRRGITPPDYYIRTSNGIIIFEFKDTLLNANIKDVRTASRLFSEIKKKFFESRDSSPKGVRQLINGYQAITNGNYIFDCDVSDEMVYPVLVVDNPTYTIKGMRTVLEYMMRDYCRTNSINDARLRPLIIMDVATLSLYSETISQKGFIDIYESYYCESTFDMNEGATSALASLVSFTEYMKKYEVGKNQIIMNQLISEARKVLIR